MIIAGIDPGLTGAIAVYDTVLGAIEIIDMPTVELRAGKKKRHEIMPAGIAAYLEASRPDHVVVEQVNAMPSFGGEGGERRGMGATSAFRFGMGYGAILGVCAALRLPVTKVVPVVWKKALRVPAGKDAARARATELLPRFAQLWPLKKHDGRAEAALLALYGVEHVLRAMHGSETAIEEAARKVA